MAAAAGWSKELLKEGSGASPTRGKTVTVHCTGFGKNGDLSKKFWSTLDDNKPFSFQLGMGKVIRGWDEGVASMKLGERARFTLSPSYAYGAGGFPAWGIMPNSTLVFEIELLRFE